MLSSVLLVILLGVSLLLSRGLYNSAEALAEEARYVEVLRTASAAQKSFGDVKYWLTDLAVSLLNLSEERARQARTTFEAQLDALEPPYATTSTASWPGRWRRSTPIPRTAG
jgi:hypothetical protein